MIVRRAAGKYFFQVNFPSRHRASHVKTSEYMAPPHTVVAVFIRKARVKLRSRVMWIIPALRYPYAHWTLPSVPCRDTIMSRPVQSIQTTLLRRSPGIPPRTPPTKTKTMVGHTSAQCRRWSPTAATSITVGPRKRWERRDAHRGQRNMIPGIPRRRALRRDVEGGWWA